MEAFVPSVSIGSRSRQSSLSPICSTRAITTTRKSSRSNNSNGISYPCMMAPITLTVEIISISAFSVLAYNLLNQPGKAETQPSQNMIDPISNKNDQDENNNTSIFSIAPTFSPDLNSAFSGTYLGLKSMTAPPKQIPLPQSGDINSVGVAVEPSKDEAVSSSVPSTKISDSAIKRQLQWAVEEMVDINDCLSSIIIDTANNNNSILVSYGNESILSLLSQEPQQKQQKEEEENKETYSFNILDSNLSSSSDIEIRNLSKLEQSNNLKSIAYYPIGETKLTIVMFSSLPDFLGPKEKRLVKVVSDKLANIIS